MAAATPSPAPSSTPQPRSAATLSPEPAVRLPTTLGRPTGPLGPDGAGTEIGAAVIVEEVGDEDRAGPGEDVSANGHAEPQASARSNRNGHNGMQDRLTDEQVPPSQVTQ